MVSVVSEAGQRHLVALRPIREGQIVLRIEGVPAKRPSRHSVQVAAGLHISPSPAPARAGNVGQRVWPYMNHSCEPNVCIRGLEVVAIRSVRTGEPITFNYNTTEYEMASPFRCHCGSLACAGEIRGFKYLDRAARELLRPYLSRYLLAALDEPERQAEMTISA
jgi:hypothetical protein